MKRFLEIGGVNFCLDSERLLQPTEEVIPFHLENTKDPELSVRISWDWIPAKRPQTPPAGQDLVQIYYREGDWCCCELDGGDRGALARTWYRPDFSEMVCFINHVTCHVPQNQEGQILRMLPMREIFLHFDTLFFHAAQIAYQGRGILFTAPSGTGKTTQAKLWRDHRGAEIICNDRTLIRNGLTYGYPMDGSEPVRSNEVYPLAAIVVLGQSQQNQVHRLRPGLALAKLLPQIVFDTWNPQARDSATEQLMKLIEQYPIYQLDCTADVSAVMCLEQRLKEDGVIQ